MLRSFIAIILLIILSFPFIIKAGLVVHWKINQSYITEKYCINKSKPELECNGKCHLKEEIQQIEQKSTSNATSFPIELISKINISSFVLNNNQSRIQSLSEFQITTFEWFYQTSLYLFDYSKNCFHPPEWMVS